MDIFTIVATILGSVGGASGILTLYSLRPKKDSFSIKNMTNVMNEIKAQHKEFKEEANCKIESLERRLNKLDLKDRMQTRARNKGYRCKYLLKSGDINAECPIITEFETEIKVLDNLHKNKISHD